MKRAGLLILLLAAILPWAWPNNFVLIVATQMVIAAIFAVSLNVLIGNGGLVTFGHAAFFGLASYIFAISSVTYHVSLPAAIALTLIGVPLVAMAFAAIALRASGISFVMITLALGQLFWAFAVRSVDVTGGDNGIPNVKGPAIAVAGAPPAAGNYLLGLVALVLCVIAVQRFLQSNIGVALQGTRDQPRRMAALGYNVKLIQIVTFAFAGFWAAVAGLLQAFSTQFASPGSMGINESAEVLLMVIVGGVSTIAGPIVGAVFVVFFKSIVSMVFQQWLLILGLTFFAVVFFIPDGIVDGTRRLIATRRSRSARP